MTSPRSLVTLFIFHRQGREKILWDFISKILTIYELQLYDFVVKLKENMPKAKKKSKNKRSRDDSDQNESNQNLEVESSQSSQETVDSKEKKKDKKKQNTPKKVKNSPRKLGKLKCRSEFRANAQGASATFLEDDNVVIMETSEIEEEVFPVENTPVEEEVYPIPQNNNAMVDQEGNTADSQGEESETGSISTDSDEEDLDLPRATKSGSAKVQRGQKMTREVKLKRKSVEDIERELREVNKAMAKMQKLMEQGSAYHNQTSTREGRILAPISSGNPSHSEATIYRNAVNPAGQESLRQSSSTDEGVDTSDEFNTVAQNVDEFVVNNNLPLTGNGDRQDRVDEPVAGPSGYQSQRQRNAVPPAAPRQRMEPFPPTPRIITPEEQAANVIREAEQSKARMIDVTGTSIENFDFSRFNNNLMHSVLVDENFLFVAAHIEESLRQRIENGEYVDFARLLPRDRVMDEQDNRMEWVHQDGRTFLAPITDRSRGSSSAINSFARWEQAFRVYSDIYTRAHPGRAAELIQYNHIINTAALTYSWENVYVYDCQFRVHMGRNPNRSWAIILQQAWTMYLKDRNKQGYSSEYGSRNDKRAKQRDICYRFNRGKCTYGNNCKFEHRCAICNKFGHGAHNCRKLDRWDSSSHDKKPDYGHDKGGDKRPPNPPSASLHGGRSSQSFTKAK